LRLGVDEDGPRTAIKDGVAAAHEGQRRAEHRVTRLHAKEQQREVNRRRAGTHRRRVADARVSGQLALETVDVRAERRDPVGLEGVVDERALLVAQVR